jgi:hypothetical protein
MYTEKDGSGKISIMEISKEDANDIGAILFEFEYLVRKGDMSEKEQARLVMFSTKLRFQLIDALT